MNDHFTAAIRLTAQYQALQQRADEHLALFTAEINDSDAVLMLLK